jgi:superfamily II DNA/RNA helicase
MYLGKPISLLVIFIEFDSSLKDCHAKVLHHSLGTDRMGFISPTLIQEQTIPLILSGRHVYPFVPFFTMLFQAGTLNTLRWH